ncbi:MAG: ATP synthase subunit I [Lachnospiraceae bacterium]|nr:ATP synthase subunit I [Lachnospiraceae bacterium]
MIKIIQTINDMNKVLIELLAGILGIGILGELIGVWFVADKFGYSIGLLVGILLAMAMAVHMAWAINRVLDLDKGAAEKQMRANSILRYTFIVVALVIVMVTKTANPLAAFLGIMSLKVAAYIQPITHKLVQKISKNEEKAS